MPKNGSMNAQPALRDAVANASYDYVEALAAYEDASAHQRALSSRQARGCVVQALLGETSAARVTAGHRSRTCSPTRSSSLTRPVKSSAARSPTAPTLD